ncbi:DUF6328 family protein [Kitasatospora sp. NBC_00240]|nr:DUF6328 family protein [Kitasatospora sp. NBC_00240]
MAPVAFHRFLAGRNLKPQLTRAAGKLIATGLALLAPTIGCALLLLLRTATGNTALSWALSAVVLAWFATTWLVLPRLLLHRADHGGGHR